MPKADFDPVHPAEFFVEDFMKPLSLTVPQVADAVQLPESTVKAFLDEVAPLSTDLALRFERAFGCSAEFWMSWQTGYDLRRARERGVAQLETIQRVTAA